MSRGFFLYGILDQKRACPIIQDALEPVLCACIRIYVHFHENRKNARKKSLVLSFRRKKLRAFSRKTQKRT